MQLKPKKRTIAIPHPNNQFFPSTIEVFGCLHSKQMCFYTIVPMSFGASKGQMGPPIYVLILFFIKKIQLHCKGCKHHLSFTLNP
jgi:hypothetical protein